MKILIDKEKLEEELNKLNQHTSYDEWEQGRKTGKIEILESILQQGEEYNEVYLQELEKENVRLKLQLYRPDKIHKDAWNTKK